jgi:dihydrofolate reductase
LTCVPCSTEGGPTLFEQFLRHRLVDELFMTLAPQIAGRLPQTTRPGLAEGMEFLPDTAPWFQLLSVKLTSRSSVPSLPCNFEAVNMSGSHLGMFKSAQFIEKARA